VGGNLDNKHLTAGSRLYLPIEVAGGLFSIGDGHAAQGDGEIDGAAVESSFDVTFTVDLIKGKTISWPRLENDEVIMSIGSTRPLIDALRIACVDLINWLVEDYGDDELEANQLLGQAARIEVANVVDPQYSVACQLEKKYLPQ
jgi:acetamidase/formamidase